MVKEMRGNLFIFEIIAAILTAVLAAMWIFDPSGSYEPWIVICSVVFIGTEIYRRKFPQDENTHKSLSKPEVLIQWIQSQGLKKPLSQVLPKTLQLSQLLDLQDLEHWSRMELYGYNQEGGMTEQDIVPEYREVNGRYMDIYDRMLQVPSNIDFVNGYRFRYGVRQLEELAQKEKISIWSFGRSGGDAPLLALRCLPWPVRPIVHRYILQRAKL